MAVVAMIAVILAVLPMGAAIAFAIVTGCLILVQRTQLPRGSSGKSTGCLCAILGLVGGGVFGATRAGAAPDGLLVLAMAFVFGVTGAVVVGLAGHFIAFVLYRGQQPAVEQTRLCAPDPAETHRIRLLAEYELVEQLMSQAEKDGDNEVFTKLGAYRVKLKHDLVP